MVELIYNIRWSSEQVFVQSCPHAEEELVDSCAVSEEKQCVCGWVCLGAWVCGPVGRQIMIGGTPNHHQDIHICDIMSHMYV